MLEQALPKSGCLQKHVGMRSLPIAASAVCARMMRFTTYTYNKEIDAFASGNSHKENLSQVESHLKSTAQKPYNVPHDPV